MKEIQEQRVEKEMELLSTCDYVRKMKKVSKDEVHVEVEIPGNFISEDTDKNIDFLIIMTANFPLAAPKVLSKSGFCFPNISDGRDLLEDIINNSWHPSFRILDVINRIPAFCQEFMKSLSEGILTLVGAYYLGDKYDFSFLESLPVHLQRVKEVVMIDGKEKEYQRILLVSDIYICLFEQDKWNKNNLMLIFWSNLRSLVTIKKTINGDVCKFYWKQKNRKKNFELILVAEKSSILIEMILDRMSKYGINYKINKNIPRSGKIPDIDIESVEKSILEIEQQIEQNPDLPHVEYLMDLYSKAVEYYSATNDPKFEYYKNKIHETLSTPRMNTFLSEETEHEDNIAKEPQKGKKQQNDLNETQNMKVNKEENQEKNLINNEKENSISTTLSNRIYREEKEMHELEREKNIFEKPEIENKAKETKEENNTEIQDLQNKANTIKIGENKEIVEPENEEKTIEKFTEGMEKEESFTDKEIRNNSEGKFKNEVKEQEGNESDYSNETEFKVSNSNELNNQDIKDDVSDLNQKTTEQPNQLKEIEKPKEDNSDKKEKNKNNSLPNDGNNSIKVEKEESQDSNENKEPEKPSATKVSEEPKLKENSEQEPKKTVVEVKTDTVAEKPKIEEKKDKIEVKLEIEEDENLDNIKYSSDEEDY